MTIDISGCDCGLTPTSVWVRIEENHPLVRLGNALPWKILVDFILQDLQQTTKKGIFSTGRRVLVRVHLAAFILQKIYDLTDRQTEYSLKDNAAYQLFAGRNVVHGWRSPDHTSIEKFRNRLSPQTQSKLANEVAKIAVNLGFANPSATDFDSTVQEANIAYPSDASLMTKLAGIGKKVIDYLNKKAHLSMPKEINIDMKAIKKAAREYFFLARNAAIEKRRQIFQKLHQLVKHQIYPVISTCNALSRVHLQRLPWHIHQGIQQINTFGKRYLLDVAHFIRNHTIKAGKALSFHASQVACIKKGKAGKEMEFGRVFQIGRIAGNFLFVLECTSVRMEDKSSLIPLIEAHAKIFGKDALASVATDKAYWSMKNSRHLQNRGIKENGLGRPANLRSKRYLPPPDVQEKLRRRRAGIEPLIGRAKWGGQLGKSRMRSDGATLAAGYGSILGFNLRQLRRCFLNDKKRAAS